MNRKVESLGNDREELENKIERLEKENKELQAQLRDSNDLLFFVRYRADKASSRLDKLQKSKEKLERLLPENSTYNNQQFCNGMWFRS